MTTGIFQPYGRIEPVAPVPSILTTARPLPSTQAAYVTSTALAAVKDGESPELHIAAVQEALDALGEGMYQELKQAMRTAIDEMSGVEHFDARRAAIDVKNLFTYADNAWRTGVAWNPIACTPSYMERFCTPYTVDESKVDEVGTQRTAATQLTIAHASPFTFYTPVECDWELNEARIIDIARVETDVNTAYAFGRALWFGDGVENDDDLQVSLRHNATDISTAIGGTQSLDIVVAALLSAYETATRSGGAVLHIPSVLMTGAIGGIPGGGKVATLVGNYYQGPLGSVVSPGPGYPHGASEPGANGNGPRTGGAPSTNNEVFAGNTLSEAWVYVTGPVEYAQTPVMVDYAMAGSTMRQNTTEAWGKRMGIVRFDPCTAFAARATNYAGNVS